MNAQKKKAVLKVVILLIWLITVLRCVLIFRRDIFIDFLAYCDVSRAIAQGLNPYDKTNLIYHNWGDIPIVFPGYTLLFIGFTAFGMKLAQYLFVIINIILGYITLRMLFRRTGLIPKLGFNSPGIQELLFSSALFCVFNSSPFLATLRHGQTTIIIASALTMILLPSHFYGKVIAFALTAVLKYSMLPLFGLALFFKKYFMLCIYSFIIFLVFAVSPILFGHNLIDLYKEYIGVVSSQATKGFNTFEVSGYNMVSFDLFKIGIINTLVKAVFGVIGLWLIIRETGKRKIGLNFMLAISGITMLTAYNRMYNLVFIFMLLAVKAYIHITNSDSRKAIIPGIILLGGLFPLSLLMKTANYFGSFISPDNPVIYLCRYGNTTTIFPFMPIDMSLLTLYFIYCVFFEAEVLFFEPELKLKSQNHENLSTN